MKNFMIFTIAAIVIALVVISLIMFLPTKSTEFRLAGVLGEGGKEVTFSANVDLPLDENEACVVASAAASRLDWENFECDEVNALGTIGLQVADVSQTTGFATAKGFIINEQDRSVTTFQSP